MTGPKLNYPSKKLLERVCLKLLHSFLAEFDGAWRTAVRAGANHPDKEVMVEIGMDSIVEFSLSKSIMVLKNFGFINLLHF